MPPESGLLQIGCKLEKWQWRHNFSKWRHRQIFLTLFCLFCFMSISLLVLELWPFPFIRDWPEIRKSEICPSEFCPISRNWSELGIPNLARASLIKCYELLQNARVTVFTVSELLREYQQDNLSNFTFPPPPKLGLSHGICTLTS